jgi:D-ribose pyranose/furanose isomerase RbsD
VRVLPLDVILSANLAVQLLQRKPSLTPPNRRSGLYFFANVDWSDFLGNNFPDRSHMRSSAATAAVLFALSIGMAQAQTPAGFPKPASPEEMRKAMDASMASMMDNMARMTEAMTVAQLNIAAKPETAERIAEFKKNLYDALLRKGFTQDQAIAIVSATALPAGAAK